MPPVFPPGSALSAFTEDDVQALLGAGKPHTCAADEVIFAEGDAGDSVFFLLEGAAEAKIHGGATVRTYGPGSYFGELSFINPEHRRSATLVASTAVKLQVLDQTSVQQLMTSHPSAICTLLRRACVFLVDTERTLVASLRRRNTELQETIKRLDFTARRLSQEEETARTDGLTGLSNRRAFDAELPVFIERAQAIGSGLALLAIDLDHFKPVNDTLGHAAGDFVLKEVGKILREKTRKTDLACRIGGDEFMVLLSDITDETARIPAEALRAAIGSFTHPGNEQGIRITTTMGGTLYRAKESVADFMHRADEALYAAKRAGRNRVGWV
jgi:diguanylate cyclase (GGDEF)-like protein